MAHKDRRLCHPSPSEGGEAWAVERETVAAGRPRIAIEVLASEAQAGEVWHGADQGL